MIFKPQEIVFRHLGSRTKPISFIMCPEYCWEAVFAGLLMLLQVLLSMPKPPRLFLHPGHLAELFLQLAVLKSDIMPHRNASHTPTQHSVSLWTKISTCKSDRLFFFHYGLLHNIEYSPGAIQ